MDDYTVKIGKAFGVPTRAKILMLLLTSKEEMNMTDIYNKLKNNGYDIAYKNVTENIKVLEDLGLLVSKKNKTQKGIETKISWSEMLSSKKMYSTIKEKGKIILKDLPLIYRKSPLSFWVEFILPKDKYEIIIKVKK